VEDKSVAIEAKQNEVRARMILTCAVDDKHTTLISSCKTARDIWKRLEAEYYDKEPCSVEAILTEYYTIKMRPNQSVSEYISKVENLTSKMAELGKPISETAALAKIVSGLPSKYADLRRAWDFTPPDFKSMNLLLTNLKKEEKSLKENTSSGEALYARRSSNNSRRRNNDAKKNSKCKWCNKVGHWWSECPTRPEDQVPSGVRRCGRQQGEEERTVEPETTEKALCAYGDGSDAGPSGWFLDSGASTHMTGRRSWLVDYQQLGERYAIRVETANIFTLREQGHFLSPRLSMVRLSNYE